MRAVMLEVPQALLDERRAKGLDKSDEMWEGELHIVPPPSGEHQALGAELFLILGPIAKARGLLPRYGPTGLLRPGVDDDWRVPDQLYARPELASTRGFEGAASLVVEILSPNDETYRKLDWYASVGVDEVLVIEPVVIECLGVSAETVDGKLRLTWDGGAADI